MEIHARRAAPQTHAAVKRAASNPALEFLERAGYVARGVLYGVMGALALGLALASGVRRPSSRAGWFVFQADLDRDPTRVRGFRGAFLFLLSQPYGDLLLGVVAPGFVALGLHFFACARWMRLLGSRG
jgi:hypothetical protein